MLDDGTRVGNYVIEAFLGSGGMASVYRVRHRVLQSVHALKVLAEHLGRSRELRVRFLKEGQVLAQVQHPGLVRVTDVVDEPACAGLVMDLLEGEDLARRVARAGPLAPAEVAGIALQALSAIGHAHEAGVIHRDLKPANLFLVPRGGHRPPLVKVLDFGIAKLAGSDLTRGSGAMGTVAYMSPEQIELPAEVDERSDLFSLGVVLFELLVGENPFRADTDYLIMQRITAGDYGPPPASLGSLEPVVRRALQPDPTDRFPSARAMAVALRPFAPTEVRLMVDEWEGSGKLATTPLVERAAPVPVPLQGPGSLAGQQADLVRQAGTLQLASGIFNVFVMSAIQCFGLGWLGGLPACFGVLLWVVGCIEIASGIAALAFRNPRWIRPTAFLEILSLSGAGLLSAAVGAVILFARRRNPAALP